MGEWEWLSRVVLMNILQSHIVIALLPEWVAGQTPQTGYGHTAGHSQLLCLHHIFHIFQSVVVLVESHLNPFKDLLAHNNRAFAGLHQLCWRDRASCRPRWLDRAKGLHCFGCTEPSLRKAPRLLVDKVWPSAEHIPQMAPGFYQFCIYKWLVTPQASARQCPSTCNVARHCQQQLQVPLNMRHRQKLMRVLATHAAVSHFICRNTTSTSIWQMDPDTGQTLPNKVNKIKQIY